MGLFGKKKQQQQQQPATAFEREYKQLIESIDWVNVPMIMPQSIITVIHQLTEVTGIPAIILLNAAALDFGFKSPEDIEKKVKATLEMMALPVEDFMVVLKKLVDNYEAKQKAAENETE